MVPLLVLVLFLAVARPFGTPAAAQAHRHRVDVVQGTPSPDSTASHRLSAATPIASTQSPSNNQSLGPETMSTYERESLVATVVSCLAAVGSCFAAVGSAWIFFKQKESMAKAIESQAYADVFSKLAEIQKVIFDNNELYPYFYGGKDVGENNGDKYRVSLLLV